MIDPKYYGLIEMGMTLVFVGGFVIHQLWTLRDTGKKEDDETPDAE
jgi:hypothetical protein